MKTNLTRSLFAVCAVLAMSSCANELIEINKPSDQPTPDKPSIEDVSLVFTAGHEGVNITKSDLNSDLVPYWVEGDAIGVTTSNDANVKCDLVSAEEGTFNGSDVEGDGPYHAVYPYSAGNTFDGTVLTASVPAVQTVAAGQSVAPGALVAACVSSTNQLEFKNCVSLMQLEIPATIKQVTVTATGENEYLSGKFTMDMSAEELAVVLPESDASLSDTVTLKPEEGTFDAGTYYISVLPTALTGIRLTFTNDKDETVTIEKSAKISLARSNGVNFGAFFVYDIDTPEELYDWAKSEGKFTAWDVVNLNADLDMSEYAADFIEAVNFEGTFNGNNKTISGLTTPLFANLYGSVNNLTLNSNITYTGVTKKMPGHNQVVGILAHIAYNTKHEDAKISNVTTKGSITVEMGEFDKYFGVAGLVGGCNGITVENCENQAAVEVKTISLTGADVRVLAGGVIAQSKLDATVVNQCKNSGSVTISSGTTTQALSCIGGVIGFVENNAKITDCSNSGAVTNSAANASAYFTGGVLGSLGTQKDINASKSVAWIGASEGCTNSGAIHDNSQSATAVNHCVGGVIGFICNNGRTLDDMSNSGTVRLSSPVCNDASVGGIIGQWYQYNTATLQNSSNAATGTVTVDASSCTNIYEGGLIGNKTSNDGDKHKKPVIALNLENRGAIVNTGTASKSIRIGGISGQFNYGAVVGASSNDTYTGGCSNYGNITCSAPSQAMQTAIGGIAGQTGNGAITIYGSYNEGNISAEVSSAIENLFVGGIGGTFGTTPSLYGCINKGNIAKVGEIANAYGAALLGRSGGSMTVIKNCSIAGTIFGEEIPMENFDKYLCAIYSNANPGKDIDNNSVL